MEVRQLNQYLDAIKQRLASTPGFAESLTVKVDGDDVIRLSSSAFKNTSANIILFDKMPLVKAKSGSRPDDGALNEFINCPQGSLLPNAAYEIDKVFTYLTDNHGRVKRIEVFLDQEDDIKHLGRPRFDADKDKLPDDEFGHGVAACLGGCHEAINIFDMTYIVNREYLAHIESFLSSPMRVSEPFSITGHIDIRYPDDESVRPESFLYKLELKSSHTNSKLEIELLNSICE